jgi:hypothetical protein
VPCEQYRGWGTIARDCATVRVSGSEKNSGSDYHISGEGLLQNWMILLGHRRLQYIAEESLGVAGG